MGKVVGVPGMDINSLSLNKALGFEFNNDSTDVLTHGTIGNSEGRFDIKGFTKPFLDLDPPKSQSFFMDYESVDGQTSSTDMVDKLNRSVNLISDSPNTLFQMNLDRYNRFKIHSPDDVFQKGFAHVFFVRPNLNICFGDNRDVTRLSAELENNPLFLYAWRNSPDMVRSLIQDNGAPHDFNMYLSNKVTSFETSDEYIGTETYGKTYLGHQITYGKNNIDSKTGGDLNLNFDDDRNCHTYIINRLWMEYINLVSRGSISPSPKNILNKVLDYASSIYYIVTAEDGESIVFWSKYYGVFPTSSPSNQFSWNGDMIKGPMNYSIKYQYSFKEDFNPFTLVEFNMNTGVTSGKYGSFTYAPIFDKTVNGVGTTWVHQPYIELCTDLNNPNSGTPYNFKLRFRN